MTALRDWADLPGPRGLPLLHNALQLDPPRLHQQLEAWIREYGPAYRLQAGGARILVLADHELVARVLRDRPDGFRRTSRQELIGREMGLRSGLFAANGEDWTRQRRMVMAGFDPTRVKAYFPSLLKVTQRLKSRWEKTLPPASGMPPDAANMGQPIDLQADLMRFTVDTITGLAFGQDVNTLESDDDIIQNHLDRILPALYQRIVTLVPWWRLIPRKADRELDAAVIEVNKAIDGFIREARAGLAAHPSRRQHPANLLEAMIVAAEADDARLSDEELAGNVMTMLLAGEDTTANTLAWMIYLLTRNPEALQRAQEEVRRHTPDVGHFTMDNIGALHWLDACAHETMRLKPVAPILPVQALHDTTIGDIRITARTVVINIMRHDTLDERLVTDASAFRPERWLRDPTEQGEARVDAQQQTPDFTAGNARHAMPAPDRTLRRASMPFGAGPRICPGRYLAMLEMRMAMAMLLAHFDIAEVATPSGLPPEERLAFTMAPVGLVMRLSPRA